MNHSPSELADARWRRLADADAIGTPLSDADRALLAGLTASSPDVRAEQELYGALARLGDDAEAPALADDEALVGAVLRHAEATRQVAASSRSPSRAMPWLAAGLVTAAAAVVVAWLGLRGSTPASEPVPASAAVDAPEVPAPTDPLAPAVPPRLVVPPVEPAAAPSLTVQSGRLVDAEGTVLAEASVARGRLRVDSERACVGRDQTRACFERGAEIELGQDAEAELVLVRGEGTIEAPAVPVPVMSVRIAGERYVLAHPVTIHTTVIDRDDATIEVIEGRVELVDLDGGTLVVEAGQRSEPSRRARPSTSSPDAKTLLDRARSARAAGDRAAAIGHYERLLELHPRAPVSQAAMVSLGDLYLETGAPGPALRWFDRYLRRGGALSQEASVGRIEALGALGRARERSEAIEAFRRRYPSSRYADKLDR